MKNIKHEKLLAISFTDLFKMLVVFIYTYSYKK